MMMDTAAITATETITRTMRAKGITTNTTTARMDTMTSRKFFLSSSTRRRVFTC